MLNAGISGDTVEAILYRVESMNFPKSVSKISLLCGTNNLASTSPSVISATIIKILTVIYQKCPTAIIHVFPILPRFDHCFSLVQITSYLFSGSRMFFGTSFLPGLTTFPGK